LQQLPQLLEVKPKVVQIPEQIVVQKAMQTAEPVVEYSVIMEDMHGEHKVVLNTVPTFVQDTAPTIVHTIVVDIVD
jgi:hypothetical protein